MTSNEFSLYILLSIFILMFGILFYSLCFGNKKVDTITIERNNPGILIADNGINIIQAGKVQDYCAICNCYFKNGEEIEILLCDHIYHRNCYETKMCCVKCEEEDPTEHTHLII